MEFEEMKKICDSQNNEPFYGINEKALHNRILSKKKQAYHTTNVSELICIFAYIVTGCVIPAINYLNKNASVFMYILSAWMLISALYLVVRRIRRIREDLTFDRSMLGDLRQAVSTATYRYVSPAYFVGTRFQLDYLPVWAFGTAVNNYG